MFAFLFQVFVNVGMTIGIAPVTGIPLPMVSVGGSSMIANLARDRRAAGDPRARSRARPARSLVTKTKLPVDPAAVLGILKELRTAAEEDKPLVVSGSTRSSPCSCAS